MECVISGLGAVSPYGAGVAALWEGVSAGRVALRPVTRFDATQYRNVLGGEVPGFDDTGASRSAAYATAAAAEALRDSGRNGAGVGLVLGTNFSGMRAAEQAFVSPEAEGLEGYPAGEILEQVRRELGLTGPAAALSLSCASGAAALGVALEWVREGRCEAVLAGGFDELSETAFAGLSALRAIAKDTIRPWDKNRDGSIFAEGAGAVLVESPAAAETRGARAHARLLGRGINNDAFHMTAPDKTGAGIAAVMRQALTDAGLPPESVAHLNCHGTGTKYNDLIETAAIRAVFGRHAEQMTFAANKSLFGHAMGAAGALEAIVTCLTLEHGLVPPSTGCEEPDPEIALDFPRGAARRMELACAMSNSYGLGGTNASLVFGRAETV